MTTTAAITAWIPTSEATTLIKSHIANGLYKKGEIKKSSYRWADVKDHSKGYICRVMVEAGLHPELEVKSERKNKKAETLKALEEASAMVSEQFKAKLEKMDNDELKAFAAEREEKLDIRMKKMAKAERPKEEAKTKFINALIAAKAA